MLDELLAGHGSIHDEWLTDLPLLMIELGRASD